MYLHDYRPWFVSQIVQIIRYANNLKNNFRIPVWTWVVWEFTYPWKIFRRGPFVNLLVRKTFFEGSCYNNKLTMDGSRLGFTELLQDQKGQKQAIVYLQLFYSKSNTVRVNVSSYTRHPAGKKIHMLVPNTDKWDI